MYRGTTNQTTHTNQHSRAGYGRGHVRGSVRGRGGAATNTHNMQQRPNLRTMNLEELFSLQRAVAEEIQMRSRIQQQQPRTQPQQQQPRSVPIKERDSRLDSPLETTSVGTTPLPHPLMQDYADTYRGKHDVDTTDTSSTTITLYMKGLPGKIDAETLQAEIERYTDTLVEVCLILTEDDDPTGTAYILLEKPEDGLIESLLQHGLCHSEKKFCNAKLLLSRRCLLMSAELDKELDEYMLEGEVLKAKSKAQSPKNKATKPTKQRRIKQTSAKDDA